jgi:hypothetical protein
VPGFDDAGVHRADGDPMQALAFDGKERIARLRIARRRVRRHPPPATVIEPGPLVGRAARLKAVQITDRPLEPTGGRMVRRDGREHAVAAFAGDDTDLGE